MNVVKHSSQGPKYLLRTKIYFVAEASVESKPIDSPTLSPPEQIQVELVDTTAETKEESEDDVKDAWDASSSSSEEEENTSDKVKVKGMSVQKQESKDKESKEDDDEDEEEEEDDEEDEDEDEDDDDDEEDSSEDEHKTDAEIRREKALARIEVLVT